MLSLTLRGSSFLKTEMGALNNFYVARGGVQANINRIKLLHTDKKMK
jgi:hypothetical protein